MRTFDGILCRQRLGVPSVEEMVMLLAHPHDGARAPKRALAPNNRFGQLHKASILHQTISRGDPVTPRRVVDKSYANGRQITTHITREPKHEKTKGSAGRYSGMGQ